MEEDYKLKNPLRAQDTFKLFLLTVFLFFMYTSCAWARDIYVRLSDRPSLAIKSDGTMTLTDAAKKQFNLGKSVTLTRSGTTVAVGNNKFQLPVRVSTTELLGFNNRKYKGEFLLTREFLINALDVEDYVMGVLPAEGVASWPKEYQKVQAIISRTYGLRQSLNRSAGGYDVVDNTSDQVYRGAGVETPATNQAVLETAGEVLTYGDTLAFTPYHSDSGGHTAANAHVWGRNIPYLNGVREAVTYQSPNSSWTAKISASQVQAALAKSGINVGKVKEVRIAEVDAAGRAVTLTFVGSSGSASVKSSTFRTTVGSNLLRSTFLTGGAPMAAATPTTATAPAAPTTNAFPTVQEQVIASLKAQESTWPDVSNVPDSSTQPPLQPSPSSKPSPPSKPAPPVPTSNTPLSGSEETRLTRMTSDGIFSAEELMDMLMNPDKRKGYLYIGIQRSNESPKPQPAPNPRPPVALPNTIPEAVMPALVSGEVIHEDDGYFVFRGRGWGHGVGLSQWGAMAMAKAGWKAESILGHYYPGTVVKRFK